MCDFSRYGGPSADWLAIAATLPTPQANQSVSDLKKTVNAAREAAATKAVEALGLGFRIATHDYSIPLRDGTSTIEARTYRPSHLEPSQPLPVYIHFHGGGFLFGSLGSEDATCASIAVNNEVVVLNVNYRHTPEHAYPAAWDDAHDAFEWLHDNIELVGGDPEKVILGGISAGAQLVASLILEKHLGKVAKGRPAIAGQVLMIPLLVHMDCYQPQLDRLTNPGVSSYEENKNAPVLSAATVKFFGDLLKIENPDVNDTKLNPGNATPEQVKGLPPTVFGIAGLDPLRDEGLLYGKLLAEAGVATDVSVFQGVPHAFRQFGDKLAASKRWDEVVENGIRWALSKPAPSGKFTAKAL
ncbi:Alpha/Beta hydrolase protein [Podospora didyma]|uniref:Alpha/Beta hydrolase protein n=1 Tax=Podospora didyma TaxID=330526 RepID=A0AAE0U1A1_9PEZI|nr:Alpha/Beta hydrolase protein [Podospora didyma]